MSVLNDRNTNNRVYKISYQRIGGKASRSIATNGLFSAILVIES